MKRNIFLSLLMGLFILCKAQTITLLERSEVFTAPYEMVAMDKYTFGKYHYTSEKYDTLKKEVLSLDSLLRSKDSTEAFLINEYKEMLSVKDMEVNTYKEGYQGMKNELETSIDKNNQLILDYKKLEHKNRRTKRWRNIFLGSTFFTTGIIVLIIAI